MLFLACALVNTSCVTWVDWYGECPGDLPGEEGESIPPCPEAGANLFGDAGPADAMDAGTTPG